jgi:putative nucleotidyltransferase with HDIG domain
MTTPVRRARGGHTPPSGHLGALTLASAAFAETLINAMEAKNAYLRGHSQRVADLAASTAEALGLSEDVVEQVRLAGRLHDIGKIGIREAVLDKPGPLDAAEYAHVKDHVRIGLEILAPMTDLGPVLAFIADHHERLDGSGYPRGLAGEAISLGGRVIAAADMFDALTSRRAYRDSRSEGETLAYMAGLVGTALFPDVFAALRRAVEQRHSLVFLGEMRAPGAHLEQEAARPGPGDAALAELVGAVATLPRAERLALTLHYLEQLGDAEIGLLLEGDAAGARALRRSALRRLAKAG